MKMRISYAFFLILVVHIGLAWGQDLKITLENEVAVITPDMVILPQEKGSLEGRTNSETLESSEKRPPFNNRYKEHRKSYVSKDKTVAAIKYGNAGFIESGLAPVGIVAKLFDNKLGTNGGIDEVFVDIGKRQGIEKGDRFTVYSKERMIYHPIHLGDRLFKEDTRRVGFVKNKVLSRKGRPLGHRVLIHGVLEITELGKNYSYASLVKAYEAIQTGNFLAPYQKIEDQNYTLSEIEKNIGGYIVASKRDRIGLAFDDIVYIDKGWDDDVRPGDRFEVYTVPSLKENIWYKKEGKKTPLLPFVLGIIKVIATQGKTATAIVVKSNLDMKIGNKIRFKKSGQPG